MELGRQLEMRELERIGYGVGPIRERAEADGCCLVGEPCKNITWHIIIGGRNSGFLCHIRTEFYMLFFKLMFI